MPHVAPDDAVEVLGVYCKNGHFDDPSARFCAVCGIAMTQQTLVLRKGPRPPLGVLVLDDGTIFSLDKDFVIGRDPQRDPDVAGGTANPLRVDDPNGALSRVHARIHLDNWTVTVVDLGSANGTGIWQPGDSQWTRVPPQTPVPIRPGTQVGFGRNQLRFESHVNT
jgi:pSer/pThr/pTyr-binding forkhead associated (FHA) protein